MPAATGFMPTTRQPSAASPRSSATATRVLPTPVSVPVTKMPRAAARVRQRRHRAAGPRGGRTKLTIARPSARRVGARLPGVAVDDLVGRRKLRVGRRARSASRPASSALPAPRAHQAARAAARALVAPIAFRSRSIASALGVGQREAAPCPSPGRRSPRRPACRRGRACRRSGSRAARRRRRRRRARSSCSVSGPKVVNVSRPPTVEHAQATRRTPRGRSVTHCSARLLQTRSKAPAAKRQRGDVAADEQRRRRRGRRGEAAASRRLAQRCAAPRSSPARTRSIGSARSSADARARPDSAPRARPARRRCRSRHRGCARGASRTTSRRAAMPRADLALQHRGAVVGRGGAREVRGAPRARSIARRGPAPDALSGHRETRPARGVERVGMRQERRVRRRRRSRRSARRAARRRASAPPPAGASVSRSPAMTSVGCAIAATSRAQVDRRRGCASAAPSTSGAGSPRANRCLRISASAARPWSLPCTCSDRKRCSVSRYATRSSSPKRASVAAAIACGQSVAGDEARRRADQHQPRDARRPRQRPAPSPPRRPATSRAPSSGVASAGDRGIDGRDDRVERVRIGHRAVAVPGQVDGVHAVAAREARQQRPPQPRVQRPAVQQHQRRPLPDRFDVHACNGHLRAARGVRPRGSPSATHWTARSPRARAAPQQRVDVGQRVRGRQRDAQPRGALRAPSAAGSPAPRSRAPTAPSASAQRRVVVADDERLDRASATAAAPRQRRARRRGSARSARTGASRRAGSSRMSASAARSAAASERRRRGRVDVGPRRLHQRLDHRRMRGHERAGDAGGLAQRAHVDDALGARGRNARACRARARPARRSRGRRRRPARHRALGELEQRRQRRQVAVHAEHRVGGDQLARAPSTRRAARSSAPRSPCG